jgi:anthranilate synthase component 2
MTAAPATARGSVSRAVRLLIIDNYDSFAYNLLHYAEELGADARCVRNDAFSAADALALNPDAVLISPGPRGPEDAGLCVDLIRAAPADLPILGVCLGHQAIAAAFGARIVPAREVMHGKTSLIRHMDDGVLSGLPDPFTAARYHSLGVARDSVPDSLVVNAWTEDGEIMGLRHVSRPVHGVQFHPESIASEHGHDILRRFLAMAGLSRQSKIHLDWIDDAI